MIPEIALVLTEPEKLQKQADEVEAKGLKDSEYAENPHMTRASARQSGSALRAQADLVEKRDAKEGPLDDVWEERRRKKVARLRERAANKRVGAAEAGQRAVDLSNVVPFGQPIMIGHHSEGRHRALIKRTESAFRKSAALSTEANNLDRRAEAKEGNTAIDARDPRATEKLVDRIAELREAHEWMKKVNVAWRKEKRPPEDDVDAWKRMAERLGVADCALEASRLNVARDYRPQGPFPTYTLSGSTANIKRLEKRLAGLKAREGAVARPDRRIGDIRITDNMEFHKVEIHFPGKPDEDVRRLIKQHGFRWIRTAGVWSRNIGANANNCEQLLAKHLGKSLVVSDGK